MTLDLRNICGHIEKEGFRKSSRIDKIDRIFERISRGIDGRILWENFMKNFKKGIWEKRKK